MKVFAALIAIAASAIVGGQSQASPTPCAAPAAGYPRFCAIPSPPSDVPTAGQFRRSIEDIQAQGDAVRSEAHDAGWSLPQGAATGFAAEARAGAAPPPPMTSAQDTAGFAAQAEEAAEPPARHHHP